MLEETDTDLDATLSVPLVWQFIRRHRKPKDFNEILHTAVGRSTNVNEVISQSIHPSTTHAPRNT